MRSQEGKVGLERAFLTAGARSVLGTLWTVDDEATGRFMRVFYQSLRQGRSKVSALREAKLVFLRGEVPTVARVDSDGKSRGLGRVVARRDFRDPTFWAAFVLSGDGGTAIQVPADTGSAKSSKTAVGLSDE